MVGSLRLGLVTAVQHDSHTVDLIMVDDGWAIGGVQVVSQHASSNTGLNDIPVPSDNGGEVRLTKDRDCLAIVAFLNTNPIVLGFVYPQVSQLMFDEAGRAIYRHGSDVYWTIQDDGSVEFSHPSGTFIRIAEDPAHEDLTGKDLDGKWKIVRNTTRAPHIHVEQANAGTPKASIDIDPDGNTVFDTRGTLHLHADGDITIDSDTHIGLTAPRIDEN